jgi:hypothetical protein
MKLHRLLVIGSLCLAGWAHADIYKRVDDQGHVTYSSEPIKGGKKLFLKPLPTLSGAPNRRTTPEDFPRVDTQTQKSRDAARRVILEDELSTEEKLLATARDQLQTLETTQESIVGADGVPFRNQAKSTEKIKAAQDSVSLHEQNIKALKTEISNLK